MKTELEHYLDLITESVQLFAHFTKGLDDRALAWAPNGFDKSAGSVVLEACLDVQEELGKEVIERTSRTPDRELPAPTRANVDEAIAAAVAFIQWHRAQITEGMLNEARVRGVGTAKEEVTVRELLLLLLRHLGNHIGWVRLIAAMWRAQQGKEAS